jgi:hypothetical protein
VFLRVQQPVFIGGGRDNIVTNNVFAWSSPAAHIDGRATWWPGLRITNPENEVVAALRQVPIASRIWRTRYPRLARFMQDDPTVAKRNEIRDNLLIGSELLHINPDADKRDQIFAGNREISDSRSDTDAAAQTRRARRARDLLPLLVQESVTLPVDRMDRGNILSGMAKARPPSDETAEPERLR